MSERIPKQPLNDPEYTVPEYSVLLPSDEPKNSTAESNTVPNNTAPSSAAPSGAVDTNTAEDNAPGDSTPEHATTDYREATAGYNATVSEHAGWVRPKALRSAKRCTTAIIILSLFTTIQLFLLFGKPIAGVERYLTLSCVCWGTLSSLFLSRSASSG